MTTAAITSNQTREAQRLELLKAGKADRPWAFLPVAIAWLDSNPADHGIRFLAGQNATLLGLPTIASDLLDALPEEAAQDDCDVGPVHGWATILVSGEQALDL